MLQLIKNINYVEPYKITLSFKSGDIKTVDFADKLIEWSKSNNSKFAELLDEKYFMTVKLNEELDTIYWNNGIDFCPDCLYDWGE